MKRAAVLLLDSFGIGGAPDAGAFGDAGADTFGHIYEYRQKMNKPLALPNLYRLGLLRAAGLSRGQPFACADSFPVQAAYGYASPVSRGKDSLSGHWEIAGVPVTFEWGYFSAEGNCFPPELLESLIKTCALPGILNGRRASGTEILEKLGEEHIRGGRPIVYTSADSVLQIAAHEETFGLERLYSVCAAAFCLTRKYNVARVIARPFAGNKAGAFVRTGNRRDYAAAAPGETLLDRALARQREVTAVGKTYDIFAQRGISRYEKGGCLTELFDKTLKALPDLPDGGLLFANFVDFDSRYGHRRDADGYARALEYFDRRLPEIFTLLAAEDLLVITADHGCDPAWGGSDHTRENIPALFFGRLLPPGCIGHRRSFADIGQTIAGHLSLGPLQNGIKCF
ncbi:MAG: phosphopentomutase [Acidaminococcales bacterium]|nr:phosphopentomutase [Acidaminococcales bacterium]